MEVALDAGAQDVINCAITSSEISALW
jgi:hypothetical protein